MTGGYDVEWTTADHFAAIARALAIAPTDVMAALRVGDVVRVLYTPTDEPEFVYARELYDNAGDLVPAPTARYVGTVREVLELGALAEHIKRTFGEPTG